MTIKKYFTLRKTNLFNIGLFVVALLIISCGDKQEKKKDVYEPKKPKTEEIKKTKNFSKKEEKVRKIYRERYIDLDKYMYMYMDIIIYDVMYFYLGI